MKELSFNSEIGKYDTNYLWDYVGRISMMARRNDSQIPRKRIEYHQTKSNLVPKWKKYILKISKIENILNWKDPTTRM